MTDNTEALPLGWLGVKDVWSVAQGLGFGVCFLKFSVYLNLQSLQSMYWATIAITLEVQVGVWGLGFRM